MSKAIIIIDELQDAVDEEQESAKNLVVTVVDADSCETYLQSCTIELYGEAYAKCEVNFINGGEDKVLPRIEKGVLKKLLSASEFEIDLPQKFEKNPIARRAVQKLNLLLRWTTKIYYGEQLEALPIKEINLPRVVGLR